MPYKSIMFVLTSIPIALIKVFTFTVNDTSKCNVTINTF